jgi:uncharacterized protein with HEPN domain
MSPRDKLQLQSILREMNRMYRVLAGVKRRQFLENPEKQAAVQWHVYVIADLCKHLSPSFKKQYSRIEWDDVKAMRNDFAHEYQSLQPELVWGIASKDMPELEKQIRQILADDAS